MVIVLFVRYVQVRTRITKLLCEAKIYHIYNKMRVLVRFWDNKIGGLDVAMDEVAGMNVFDARNLEERVETSEGIRLGISTDHDANGQALREVTARLSHAVCAPHQWQSV